jgi:hypothetical protein
MSTNGPLIEDQVKQLILTFWKMEEEKAHLVDLMEVTIPDIEISMGEFAWRGYRELEDHQMGSKARSSSTSTSSPRASRWNSRAMRPRSSRRCNVTPAGGRSRPPKARR